MKNILYILLLLQTGFLLAQDKMQTVRGQVLVFTPAVTFQYDF